MARRFKTFTAILSCSLFRESNLAPVAHLVPDDLIQWDSEQPQFQLKTIVRVGTNSVFASSSGREINFGRW